MYPYWLHNPFVFITVDSPEHFLWITFKCIWIIQVFLFVFTAFLIIPSAILAHLVNKCTALNCTLLLINFIIILMCNLLSYIPYCIVVQWFIYFTALSCQPMLYNVILYSTVQLCTSLFFNVLYFTVLFHTVLYCILL